MIKPIELKLYTIIVALATLAFCGMMIVFAYQHLYCTWGPNKGLVDPIHAGGLIFFSIISVFTIVYTFFRLTEKDKKEETKPDVANPFDKEVF